MTWQALDEDNSQVGEGTRTRAYDICEAQAGKEHGGDEA